MSRELEALFNPERLARRWRRSPSSEGEGSSAAGRAERAEHLVTELETAIRSGMAVRNRAVEGLLANVRAHVRRLFPPHGGEPVGDERADELDSLNHALEQLEELMEAFLLFGPSGPTGAQGTDRQ